MKVYESVGTPSIIRNVFNDIVSDIDKVLILKKPDSLNFNIDKKINIKEDVKLLKCNLIINIVFVNNYNANINFKSCIDSDFKNCVININTPVNYDKIKVYQSLIHELTHLYELFQIKDVFKNSSWIKAINLGNFDKVELNRLLPIRYFRDLYYISLHHEVRATISSIEIFLISLFTKDKDIMLNELEKTIEFSRYISLRDFDPNKYVNDLLSSYGVNQTIRLFNIFNKVNNINFDIKNESDILKYFKGYKKYFTNISNKMFDRFNKKINEISIKVDDINNYILETTEILSYSEYFNDINENRDERIESLLHPNINQFFLQ